jgi:hypothetical protein
LPLWKTYSSSKRPDRPRAKNKTPPLKTRKRRGGWGIITTGLAFINLSKIPFFVSREDKPEFTAPDLPETPPI